MENLIEPTDREKLVHSWKVATAQGDIGLAAEIKEKIKLLPKPEIIEMEQNIMKNDETAPEGVKTDETPVEVKAPETVEQTVVEAPVANVVQPVETQAVVKRGRGRPKGSKNRETKSATVVARTYPQGEFTTKQLVSLWQIAQPLVGLEVNSALAAGTIEIVRLEKAAGRGRPSRVLQLKVTQPVVVQSVPELPVEVTVAA